MPLKIFGREEYFPELEVLVPYPFHAFAIFDIVGDKFDHSKELNHDTIKGLLITQKKF